MIDRYSVEKIINGHRADAVKAAERERLASQLAASAPKSQAAGPRPVAKLRALVLANLRPPDRAAERVEGC